ncbi:transcription factor bHLH143-like [Gastrolobium bilobum]|uniref:transcription factor bHLH143-like n=1 Tax=Gastrolobium bilobum TaxID=150636 RepID=UPI002AB2862B|nr:transcription factor bHLH143-like [Gastrolobium bilobum]XP_061365438.1 transcription factor bHLH143-like [Gastrolobium bilobum]
MVKDHRFWPCPHHVAWSSPYSNCSCMLPELNSFGHSVCLNPSTCIFPAVSAFRGFTALSTPSLKIEQTNEVQGFLQYPNSEPCLKETHTEGTMQNANHISLQKKLLIFDHSGNKTRLFYCPAFPLVQSPIVTAKQFSQAYDVNVEGRATNMGQKHFPKCSSPEESDKDHIVNEESEMHEDTEEINALLYSDDSDSGSDDDDEVTSTGRSPLATKITYGMQEQFEDTKEEVATSDWPNKRQKLIDSGYNRLLPRVDSACSVRLNENHEYLSDAESKYSSGRVHPARQTNEDNSMAGDIQLKKDKIHESLRVLESLIPGAKGKHPMLIIDGTIEYLQSLMSQTGTLGVKSH